jgi:hypothetical protein
MQKQVCFGQTIELVAGYQTRDADGYATDWNRTSVGANWFMKKHDIKFQLSYRMGENLDGVENADEEKVFTAGPVRLSVFHYVEGTFSVRK